jgi:hypothetical protein
MDSIDDALYWYSFQHEDNVAERGRQTQLSTKG